MGLQEVVAWYQRKIGTYDKQAWERTVEQRILHGLTNVPRKSTKLKTDLIDVDLVRGSSFPKAKPKHGFATVLRFALVRLLLLPAYARWWIQRTSPLAFTTLLLLYTLQLTNMAVFYYLNSHGSEADLERITHSEVLLPVFIMLILSLIHSQIVSTHTDPTTPRLSSKKRVRRTKRRTRSTVFSRKRSNTDRINVREATPLDDDGFESLNGNGSSENGDEESRVRVKPSRSALNWQPIQDLRAEYRQAWLSSTQMCSDAGSDDEVKAEDSYNSSCESENLVSGAEWPGVTTNSDDCSYSSELEQSEADPDALNDHPFAWEFGLPPTILSPSCVASDRVSCTIWEHGDAKKADLSVLDISSAIIARVETMPNDVDYFYGGFLLSACVAVIPLLCRLGPISLDDSFAVTPPDMVASISGYVISTGNTMLGQPGWERVIVLAALVERLMLACLFFFLLAVAERTFKQRFLFAKLFSQLTSSRRARKSDLPHFRLNKVRNIKTWLSVRSYLKRRGPQRSVDVIVSAAFLIALALLSFLCVECLKEPVHTQSILEALFWCMGLGVFLLRFMTLGTKINRKYRNLSVLITEQINLYLQIEQKPHKKDELMVANSVLKLAADLLKELECPFKISGLSANPYLYTITKLVILSALSAVLSEILGFKLKLHKIKIK